MTVDPYKVVEPLKIADARASVRHVFIRDLVLMASVGIHDHEKRGAQRVRINLDLAVHEVAPPLGDNIKNVVCYEEVSDGVRALIDRGHTNLVETLAEDIATMCLADPRIRSARVRVEKLNIFEDAASVGVEIERFNTSA